MKYFPIIAADEEMQKYSTFDLWGYFWLVTSELFKHIQLAVG